MSSTLDPSQLEQRLQEQLNQRMSIARSLADAAHTVASRREQLTQAETAYRDAYAAARTAGWTDTELKRAGLPAPTPRPRTRTRKSPTQNAAPDA